MLRPGQFTLKALFVATAFVAAACGTVQFIRSTREPVLQFEAALLVPVLLGGAIGALRGRVRPWLEYGLSVDGALMLLGAALWLVSLILSPMGL